MKLYKEVLIESAEQAEALPVGTLARHDDHMPVEKWRDEYGGTHWGYIEESVEADLLRGWTALVPIEAEEEHVAPDAITNIRNVTPLIEAKVTDEARDRVWEELVHHGLIDPDKHRPSQGWAADVVHVALGLGAE